MRVLLITLHDTDNCGSSLQAYALQRFLLKNGIDNRIIDYVPQYVKTSGHPFRTFLRKIVFLRSSLKSDWKFAKFKNRNLCITNKRWKSYKQLLADPPIADCYITGSDQLWNTMFSCGNDPAFYLSFTKGRKIAYAVSAGRHNIPTENLEMIRRYAADFEWISMREQSSVSQIETVVNCPVDFTCDPVLLNTAEAYDTIRADRLIKGPYIFVYLAQKAQQEDINKCIEKIKEKHAGKVVLVGGSITRCNCDIHLRGISPEEFLSLIYYADYIICNSFHGTAFSVLFNKQFITIVPPENGERIISLLHLLKLDKQCVKKGNFGSDKITDLEYETANLILHQFSEDSQRKLLNAVLGKKQICSEHYSL